eukprot:PITA_14971
MNGMRRQHTTTYTPQQNGIAERKNRTVVEMARCMLQTKGLSNFYWGDAVATAVYILNHSPTSALENMTPYEAWYGKKPNVNHFKVFGCLAYGHPTNVSVTSGLTPPSSPSSISSTSSSSPSSSPSSTRKVRRLSDIYERSANQAHEESPIGEIVNFALLAKAEFEPLCFEDACTNDVWMQAIQEEMDSIQRNDT